MNKTLLFLSLSTVLVLLPGCSSKKWNDFFGRDQYGHEKKAAARRRNATNDALTPAYERQAEASRQTRSARKKSGGPLDWIRTDNHKGNAFGGSGLSEDERAVVNRLDSGRENVSATEAREIDEIRQRNRKSSKDAQRSIL